jgi:hypothetical protein
MTTSWPPLPVELEVFNLRSLAGKPDLIRLDSGFTTLLGVNNAWFDNLRVPRDGHRQITVTGPIADQAALQGPPGPTRVRSGKQPRGSRGQS